MKPETAEYFAEAHRLLKKASEFLKLAYYEDAGRGAYLAGMNAARGLLFEDGFKVGKRHKTHREALSLALHKRGIHDAELTSFLHTVGEMKRIADYLTGEDRVTKEMAEDAVEQAKNFVSAIKKIAGTPISAPHNGKHTKPTPKPHK